MPAPSLRCESCGSAFERPGKRGPVPSRCRECAPCETSCASCGVPRRGPGLRCRVCEARSRMDRPASTPLARLLDRELLKTRSTQGQLARRIGVHQVSISDWMRGTPPTKRSLDRLREYFGERLPDIVPYDEHRRAWARELQEKFGDLGRTPEAQRRKAATQRGRKQGPSAARSDAARRRWQEGRGGITGGRTVFDSPVVYAIHTLGCRLHRHPSPSKAEWTSWARDLASRRPSDYANAETVLAIWRPRLRERGLLSGGRPPLEPRHELLVSLMSKAVRTSRGTLPPGFWPQAARAVRLSEKEAVRSGDDGRWLSRWWTDHQKHCRESVATDLTAKLTAQQAVNDGTA